MIAKIDLSNEATFNGSEQAIMEPKKINFCFGANGSGKSVIARFIDDHNQHSQSIKWSNNPIKTLVFCREFVEKHSPARNQIPGIYTMGEGAKNARDKIDEWLSMAIKKCRFLAVKKCMKSAFRDVGLGLLCE